MSHAGELRTCPGDDISAPCSDNMTIGWLFQAAEYHTNTLSSIHFERNNKNKNNTQITKNKAAKHGGCCIFYYNCRKLVVY